MDQLEKEYMFLLQMFKEIELPDDPGILDCCIWWIYQLNKVTDEKPSRNFMLKKMMNELQHGFLSGMFWQKVNFGPNEICDEQRRDGGDANIVHQVELFTKQNLVIEQQNIFIRAWLPGYLILLGDLLRGSASKEAMIQALNQYDMKGFDHFEKTKPYVKNLINQIWASSFNFKAQRSKRSSLMPQEPEKLETINKKYQSLKIGFKKLGRTVLNLQKTNKRLEEYYEGTIDNIQEKNYHFSMLEDMADELECRYKSIFNKDI